MIEKKKVIYNGTRGDSEIVYADGYFSKFGGLVVKWGAESIGFGEAYFSYDKEKGSLRVDSEMMGPEFMSKVMEKLVRDALFTDFQESTKSVESISLEEVDKQFPFKKHVLQTPFYSEDDENENNLIQIRWNFPGEKVLNVWFDKGVIGEKLDDLSFSLSISRKKSFSKGFVKAELWSWKIVELE